MTEYSRGYQEGFADGFDMAFNQFAPNPQNLPPRKSTAAAKRKAPRKGVSDPKMSRALVKANKMGRKKAGGFKKGWNQGKIMRKAHQLRRKM
jgi:hypothetical protein